MTPTLKVVVAVAAAAALVCLLVVSLGGCDDTNGSNDPGPDGDCGYALVAAAKPTKTTPTKAPAPAASRPRHHGGGDLCD